MSHNDKGETDVSPPHVSKQDVLPVESESETLDSVFRALADHRRRCICHYLARRSEPIPVDELAELVAASMSEKTRAVLTSAEIEQTRAELHQMHLPKLQEAGVVEYDADDGVVRLVESPGVTDCLRAAEVVDFE
ncbi:MULTISPECIES: DUF7344 domain-containing protein [Halorussus]|uniref:DUF7344 domain-containing protein n=1 Tax=Halorussus TaxID=1070314 RepID=UPI0020A160DE|nr:hypothetical protein [Halorussus vallis]USZ76987.1 hypothetical protein NGM07_06575 [Halorussus vallis]